MKYRKEIDGLRAFAVIPVILFHAGSSLFSGGFVGVDVFFVISGYLITTIILTEKENETFSLVNFYERRARRIIPALFLVLLVSTLFSWLWLSPTYMKDFSQSLVAVSLFSSNILFWQETGYWGVANELKPLLHTWSLAVEEQYYVFFPLFLIMMWRFKKRWILSSFCIIVFASLLLSQWAAFNSPIANFFLLPTRGWELAMGAGIAFYFLYRKNAIRSLLSSNLVDELLSFFGLVLIGYAVFVFDEDTPFPSAYALVPTIGTALVLVFSSKETFVGKLLGSRIFVGVGLISYSAYLWHQPLFAFARHRSLQEPSSWLLATLSIASLLFAFISWKYVEAPFRKKDIFSRRAIFTLTILGSIAFIIFGLIGHFTKGYQHRFDEKVVDAVNSAKEETFNKKLCEKTPINIDLDDVFCVLVGNENKFAFLYGDSHAGVLAYEAKNAFLTTDYGLIFASEPGCPPVKGVYRESKHDRHACYNHNKKVYEYLAKHPQIEYVILSARWTSKIEGETFNNKEGGVEQIPVEERGHIDIVENGEYLYHEDNLQRGDLIAQAYTNSIQSLLDVGKKVIVVYPVPETGWNVPDYLTKYYFIEPGKVFHEATASTSHEVFIARNKRTIDALDRVKSHRNLFRVYPEKLFCDNDVPERCITQKDGVIFYRDDDHLSGEGARLLLEEIMSHLK